MIWKEEDLVEINFSQQYLNPKSIVLHLTQEEKIEYIELWNVKNPMLEVHCFINGEWAEVDKSHFESDSANNVRILLYSKIWIKTLKISSNENLSLPEVKIFKRKFPALLMCGRGDGFGSRILNFLFAKYCADKSGLKFGFVWNIRNASEKGVFVDSKENIFTESFLEKYHYPLPQIYSSDLFANRYYISDLAKGSYKYYWGGYYTSVFLGKSHFKDFDGEDFNKEAIRIWNEIDFTPEYQQLIISAKEAFQDDFIAIHIRVGDVVFDHLQRRMYFSYTDRAPMNRISPIEIVAHIIKLNATKNIVLFSDEKALVQKIKDYFNAFNREIKIQLADDFKSGLSLTRMQDTIFDLVFMSQAKEIYCPKESTFSILSSFIDRAKIVHFNEKFSLEEQYSIIEAGLNIEVEPLIRAASLAYFFNLSKKLNKGLSHNVSILNKYLELDKNNFATYIAMFHLYFANNQADKVEYTLMHLFTFENFEHFINTLLWTKQNYVEYREYFQDYKLNANEKFKRISIVAARISESQNDMASAISFVCLAMGQKYRFGFENKNNTAKQKLPNEPNKQLQTQNIAFQNKIKQMESFIDSKTRIHSHLAYKLGSAMILNARSFLGWVRMPYVLSYIKEFHREEQRKYQEKVAKNPSLKLPKLESYPDYKEAIKEKQCFTYKLGEALIKANNVRGGGRIFAYLQFFKEVRELRKEFREKKK